MSCPRRLSSSWIGVRRAPLRLRDFGKLGKPFDDEIACRIRHRIGQTARPPFIRAPHEGCPVTFSSGRIEIEFVTRHHQDFVSLDGEKPCGASIGLGKRLVDV